MTHNLVKTYNIFLATSTQENHDSRRLLVATLIDDGRGKQGRCTVLPLRLDCTTADEISKAVHYVLQFAPVPSRDLEVNLIHSFPGSIDLPLSHAKVTATHTPLVQNPASQPLQHYVRNLAPMR